MIAWDDIEVPVAVVLRFDDHHHVGPGEWVPLTDDDDTATSVLLCGWLTRVGERTVTVVQSITDSNDATGMFKVLKPSITWMRTL